MVKIRHVLDGKSIMRWANDRELKEANRTMRSRDKAYLRKELKSYDLRRRTTDSNPDSDYTIDTVLT